MIFGDLVQNDSSTGKYLKVAIKERGCYPHPVDPKTVGQYTGLIDEKGVQIFEGDIVECYGEDNEVILVAEVQFQEGGFCVQIDYDLQLIPLDTFGSAYKVISNIHEPQT